MITGDLRGVTGFVAGIGNAFAGFGGQGGADVFSAGFQGIGEGTQVFGALDAGEFAPDLLRGGSRFDRGGGFLSGGRRDMADQRFGRRVIDCDQRVAGRFDELAVNKISLESHVHRPSLFLSSVDQSWHHERVEQTIY